MKLTTKEERDCWKRMIDKGWRSSLNRESSLRIIAHVNTLDKLARDLQFALTNADADCRHDFEERALADAELILGKIGTPQ